MAEDENQAHAAWKRLCSLGDDANVKTRTLMKTVSRNAEAQGMTPEAFLAREYRNRSMLAEQVEAYSQHR